ncbi:hypothetical protein L6R50_13105 [Myxococcota bacterium]|nr:hypothetical protein [Myxococcota bacterium]
MRSARGVPGAVAVVPLTSRAGTTVALPSRRTRARGAVMERSASRALSARCSCTKPTTALSARMVAMATASATSRSASETAAAAASSATMGLANCRASTLQAGTSAAWRSSLGPASARRRAASAAPSPTPATGRARLPGPGAALDSLGASGFVLIVRGAMICGGSGGGERGRAQVRAPPPPTPGPPLVVPP